MEIWYDQSVSFVKYCQFAAESPSYVCTFWITFIYAYFLNHLHICILFESPLYVCTFLNHLRICKCVIPVFFHIHTTFSVCDSKWRRVTSVFLTLSYYSIKSADVVYGEAHFLAVFTTFILQVGDGAFLSEWTTINPLSRNKLGTSVSPRQDCSDVFLTPYWPAVMF